MTRELFDLGPDFIDLLPVITKFVLQQIHRDIALHERMKSRPNQRISQSAPPVLYVSRLRLAVVVEYSFDCFDYPFAIAIRPSRKSRQRVNDHPLDILDAGKPSRAAQENLDRLLPLVFGQLVQPAPHKVPHPPVAIEQFTVGLRHPQLGLALQSLALWAGEAAKIMSLKRD